MRIRTLALASVFAAGLTGTGNAYVPQKGADRPVVAAGRAPRMHRDVTWQAPQGALAGHAAVAGWRTIWDRDTDVPLRMWGTPIAAPRASSDPAVAETAARKFLADHLAVLAPGATIGDFALVANRTDPSGRTRTVAFEQRAFGLRVVGGAVAFTFANDRLTMMSSTALPHVSVRMPGGPLPAQTLATAARDWLQQAGVPTDVRGHGERVIVPLVRSRGTGAARNIAYHVAETVSVEASRGSGRWDVWLDAGTAAPIARRSTILYASGRVLYNTPDRHPNGARSAKPAPNTTHTIGGMPVTSALDGTITWDGTSSVSVTTGLVGSVVRMTNKAGALVSEALTLQPGGSVTWSRANEEFSDAQLTAFVAANAAKQFALTRLDPNLAWLKAQIPVVVNESQTCNAYSTGDDIHFFRQNQQCANTGRLVDVVYHELGHSLHANAVIPGSGAFDSSLSEGLADTLAASITNDNGMGRGFFHDNDPLRDLDPVGVEKRWPEDATGEPHDEGEIIGGALWDLRKGLEADLGQAAGFERLLEIYYGIMQRASDIPSSYAEALVADDDDGDLSNGTPNQCTIDAAFAAHGLSDPSLTLGLAPPVREGFRVAITVKPPQTASECPPPTVTGGTLTWTPNTGFGGELPMAATGDQWSANIPTQADGTVIKYRVKLTLSDGSSISYPQNLADPEYQFYVGNVTTLWCADFENGLGEWTASGSPSERVEWEAGAPMGIGGDPKAAHGGANVLGIDLGGGDGVYYPRTTQSVKSPELDLQGHTQVRLQYWRWLNVEDGIYDQSTVNVNGANVWKNFTSADPEAKGITHTDREWRFHDIDLAAHTATGKVQLEFALTSDPGLEFSGWTLDDVCLVIAGPPSGTCGNFNMDGDEACDDGNTEDGDGCSATCTLEGDGEEAGCCSAGTNPAGPLALSLVTLGLVVRRRRRRT